MFKIGDKVRRKKEYQGGVWGQMCNQNHNGKSDIIVTIKSFKDCDFIELEEDCNYNGFEWYFNYFELAPPKQFTKADLKTGMVVTLRNGSRYMMSNRLLLGIDNLPEHPMYEKELYEKDFIYLDAYEKDLTHMHDYICYDILKVEDRINNIVLWEREEIKQYTKEELEAIVGHKFEIKESK